MNEDHFQSKWILWCLIIFEFKYVNFTILLWSSSLMKLCYL